MKLFQALKSAFSVVPSPRTGRPRASAGAEIIDPATCVDLPEWLRGGGATASGARVAPSEAERVAAVHRCVSLIASTVASLPIEVQRVGGGGAVEVLPDHPVALLLGRRPNSWMTSTDLLEMMFASVLLHGNAYAWKIESGRGVSDLIPLPAEHMTVEQRPDRSLVYTWRSPKSGRPVVFRSSQIVHMRGPTRNGYLGVGVIERARETLGVAVQTESLAGAVFRNGARPSGVLQLPVGETLSDAAYERLKAEAAEHEGPDGWSKTMILEGGAAFEPVSMTSADAQFLETRQFTRSEIYQFFGVPPHLAGDLEKATSFGSGFEMMGRQFVTFTLRPWICRGEETFGRDLIGPKSGERVRFDTTDLTRGDAKARGELYRDALQYGWMNPDEVRAKEGLPPRADGKGGEFYDPPNAAGGQPKSLEQEQLESAENAA